MEQTIRVPDESFYRGECDCAYEFMGAHPLKEGGWIFRVWAPNAVAVNLIGDFNFWNETELPMTKDPHGVWEVVSRYAKKGSRYQYLIRTQSGALIKKNDPYAFRFASLPDKTSLVWDLEGFEWSDADFREKRRKKNPFSSPVNVYEVHAGSWKRHPDGSYYSWRDLAVSLVPYVSDMGYTHIELMPVTEYPFDGSWGYQVTGYFAPTHRYGSPEDLKFFVDTCHAAGLGVIFDWVPAHFPKDELGLYEFDGTYCYESSDTLMNEHKEWGTRIFDYTRYEVVSFLMSSALFWLREYHADGLRVDAVASMLYLDYARNEYHPNMFGGNYNLDAMAFFRKLNIKAFAAEPGILMVAEESTAFPMITKPPEMGGLGFNYKWNMGWMNDTLRYMSNDPIYRKSLHHSFSFSLSYAFSENYILPFSHDEVVHLKKALVGKMPGSYEDKFASLRLLFAYMIAHPGKKLSFMGNEFAQFAEWNYNKELDWFLLSFDHHRMTQEYVRALNRFYLATPALWERDCGWDGFRWICFDDSDNSVVSFIRTSASGENVVCVLNFCPVKREFYRIGLPQSGEYELVFSSEYDPYGGCAKKTVGTDDIQMHGFDRSAEFTLPPLGALFYKIKPEVKKAPKKVKQKTRK